MAEPKSSSDRFHPGMPSIPGVGHQDQPRVQAATGPFSARGIRYLLWIGLPLLVCVGAVIWLHGVRSRAKLRAISQADPHDVLEDSSPLESAPAAADAKPSRFGPGEIARLDELSKPWSSVPFTFVRPDTHEEVPALVVRLPGAAGSSGSYWAFGSVEPYGKCDLLYLTDTKQLASQFGFAASHPMVADPCDGAVFDPLGLGTRPDGKWIRGAIVQGGALRPPLSIEVSVRGNSLYADRIE